MPEYCSSDDLKTAATANGWRFLVDRDHDGQVNTQEAALVTHAISKAGAKIDEYVQNKTEIGDVRGSGNNWLKHVCISLALRFLWVAGGDDPTVSIQDGYDEAIEDLESVRMGSKDIPGLTRVYAYPAGKTTKVPRSYMPR